MSHMTSLFARPEMRKSSRSFHWKKQSSDADIISLIAHDRMRAEPLTLKRRAARNSSDKTIGLPEKTSAYERTAKEAEGPLLLHRPRGPLLVSE